VYGGQHAQEAIGHVWSGRQSPRRQIALDHQREVVLLPLGVRDRFEDAPVGEAAAQPVQCAPRAWEFPPPEGGQFHGGEPTGERLRGLRREGRRHGPEQQEPPVALAVLVDGATHSGKDLRPRLRFVKDGARGACREFRPLEIETEPVGLLLEVVVRVAERQRERGLSALARSIECNGGVPGEPATQFGEQEAGQHVCSIEIHF
jgi:hypothetical protein